MRLAWILLFVAVLASLSAPTGPITFLEIAERAGVRFVTENSATPAREQPEGLVAGVGLLDYDSDGFLDIYFVNGAGMPSLKKEGPAHSNRLFRNNGNLTFTEVTEKAGVAGEGYGMGVASADYDNDGHPDLFLANLTRNQLLRNNGNGTFTDVTDKAGVSGGLYKGFKMWAVSAAFLDYNNDGRLDLFVSNYCEWTAARGPECKVNGQTVYCSPRHYKPLPHTLYRNNGDGTFTDVSAEMGISDQLGRGMGVAIADYDGDGWTDVFVANDDAPFQLFRNVSGKRFEEVAAAVGVQFAESGNVISGMGADFRDLMNKGLPSIWSTAIEKETFPLYINVGRGQFADKTAASGLSLHTFEMSGWSNAIVDLDNDGWKDLMVARSNVQDNVEIYSPRKHPEPNAVFRNLGNGRFANVSATTGSDFQTPGAHRGLAVGDLDNDGRMDAVVSVLRGRAKIFRNTSSSPNHWLLLKMRGTKSNRMGIGAKIRVLTPDGTERHNHATTASGYASASDARVHFGLGANTLAREIEVVWPSGVRQTLRDVKADQILEVTEPER